MADAGLVSAILWCFEFREILAETLENIFGIRLHCKNTIHYFQSNLNIFRNFNLEELLFYGVKQKILFSRLLNNLNLSFFHSFNDVVTGIMINSTGLSDKYINRDLLFENNFNFNFISKNKSCSLIRHHLRLTSIDFSILKILYLKNNK